VTPREFSIRLSSGWARITRPARPPATTAAYAAVPIGAFTHAPRATANIRTHIVRAVGRTLVLLAADLIAFRFLAAGLDLLRSARWLPTASRTIVNDRLPEGFLGGEQFAIALLISLAVVGCYGAGDRRRDSGRLMLACALAAALPLWNEVWIDPTAAAEQYALVALVVGGALCGTRALLDWGIDRYTQRPTARTLLVGQAAACAEQWRRSQRAEQQGFTYVGFVDTLGGESPAALGGLADLQRLLVELRADTIMLCGGMDEPTFTRVVKTALAAECQILSASRTLELGGLQPSIQWRRGQPFVELRAVALRGQQLVLKRLLDVLLAGAMLVVLAPVMALVAIAVRVGSEGPIVFGQRRLGRHGRSFRCYKFRSMYVDAEQRLRTDAVLYDEYVRNDYKLPEGHDPRVTDVGRVLRTSSLDELPQLWNVLKGDMSLVGPRPIVPDEIRHYEGDEPLLLMLKPGVTGAWQVNGRSSVAYPERTGVELDYVQRWSLVTDIGILLRTIPAVVARRGAH